MTRSLWLRQLYRWLFSRRTSTIRLRPARSPGRLGLEALEDRTLLSATPYIVNLAGDAGIGSCTSGDIRYCITQADNPANAQDTAGIQKAALADATDLSPAPTVTSTTGSDSDGNYVEVTVTYQCRSSTAVSVPIAPSAPALFTLDSTGTGAIAALNPDYTVNRSANPLRRLFMYTSEISIEQTCTRNVVRTRDQRTTRCLGASRRIGQSDATRASTR